jgi:hypothetical protein
MNIRNLTSLQHFAEKYRCDGGKDGTTDMSARYEGTGRRIDTYMKIHRPRRGDLYLVKGKDGVERFFLSDSKMVVVLLTVLQNVTQV